MIFKSTTEQIVSHDYPYGFRLKTDKTDYLEFNKNRGFRHCSFTINPKTDKQNAPKKSTYSDIILLGIDEETGYTKTMHFSFYDQGSIDEIINFLSDDEHFNLFTSEQKEYIYMKLLKWCHVTMKASVIYCGADFESLKPLFEPAIDILVKAINEHGENNYFSQIKFDGEAIKAQEVEGYQPFKVTNYGA